MQTVHAPIHDRPAPPDALCLSDAMGCGEHSEAIRIAIETGDWTAVIRAAERDPEDVRAA